MSDQFYEPDYTPFELVTEGCTFKIECMNMFSSASPRRKYGYVPLGSDHYSKIPASIRQKVADALELYERSNDYAGMSIQEFLTKMLPD